MNASQATLVIILLFALRCLLPLALMLAIGYAMNWMVDRWELEAEESGEGTVLATHMSASNGGRCWSIMKCDPGLRKDCPGFKQKMIPCWLARTQAEGTLPEKCITCPLYKHEPSFA